MRTVRTPATALTLLLAVAASGPAKAQEEETLEQKLEKKLKEPFVSNAPWVLDLAEATKKAKEEKKLVFAYFTRSYSP
ncbi:MAG: hypothetical protein L6Q95_04305 [Planctomycetes bacterium]|nr:hypothetical protein [Planctomycetota bacterium]